MPARNTPKKFDKFLEIDAGNKNASDSLREAKKGREGYFSKGEKAKDDLERFRDNNVEIFRRAFAKRGHKGYFSKDENHNEIMTSNRPYDNLRPSVE